MRSLFILFIFLNANKVSANSDEATRSQLRIMVGPQILSLQRDVAFKLGSRVCNESESRSCDEAQKMHRLIVAELNRRQPIDAIYSMLSSATSSTPISQIRVWSAELKKNATEDDYLRLIREFGTLSNIAISNVPREYQSSEIK